MGEEKKVLDVQGTQIRIQQIQDDDFICLTDMVKSKDGAFFIADWLRNRNTIEFLGIWEQLYNPDFNYGEFAIIKNQSGLNSFKLSIKEYTSKTSARGILAKAGRYGGTFAHKDIAFKFGAWISPEFELYLIKDYQRLKEVQRKETETAKEWDYRRFLAKVNYRIQTDAIEQYLIPLSRRPKDKKSIEFAVEADLLNLALFGKTARQWRRENPAKAQQGLNIRDEASIIQLTILANMENANALFIEDGLPKPKRFDRLRRYAKAQFTTLLKDARIQQLSLQNQNIAPPKP